MSTDYEALFTSCALTGNLQKLQELEQIVGVALSHRSLYETVQRFTAIPWPVIAAIHFRESSQSLRCHLHNGDSLSYRTVHVPKGRPPLGQPPFTWIESAIDALDMKIWRPSAWTLGGSLEFMERYNGLGYRKQSVNTPYLWNYTSAYSSGLFIADGIFDPEKIEQRPGCAAIFKLLSEKGVNLVFTDLECRDAELH